MFLVLYHQGYRNLPLSTASRGRRINNHRKSAENRKESEQILNEKKNDKLRETNLSLMFGYKLTRQIPQYVQNVIETNLSITIRIINLKNNWVKEIIFSIGQMGKQKVLLRTQRKRSTSTFCVSYIQLFAASLHEN